MKRRFKLLFIFMLAAAVLVGCQKDVDSTKPTEEVNPPKTSLEEDKKPEANEENSEEEKQKFAENLLYVEGGELGSISSYVEARQVWKDFIDQEDLAAAKKLTNGLHLPRILLDSPDAKKVNQEIDDFVQRSKDLYETYKGDLEGDFLGASASFSVYQDENILSLMVESYDVEEYYPNYKIYNFSLPEGKLLNDQELMKTFGIEDDEILEIVENSLREDQDLTTSVYYQGVNDSSYIYNPSNYTGKILQDLWDNFASMKNQFYIDPLGRPSLILAKYESLDYGPGPFILKLKADKFDQSQLADEYIKMARKLGLDPEDNKYKAFIIYLGSAYNEETLKETLNKLQTWLAAFYDYKDPNILATITENEEINMPYLVGQEFYLLVPKYKNASVSLKEVELSDDGKLKDVDNYYLDENATAGTTLIVQNISDIAPNGKITLRYRDDVLEFSPRISLKDGSLMLPDQVRDADDILDWDNLAEEEGYSPNLIETFQSLMGDQE